MFQSKAYLRDLVDATHVYVKMMEQYCGKNKHMVVQQKRKGGKGGAKKKKKEGTYLPLHEGGGGLRRREGRHPGVGWGGVGG